MSDGTKIRKFPSLLTNSKFFRLVETIGTERLLSGVERMYIEPKYDGSNITVKNGEFKTRNLYPLPRQFRELLTEAMSKEEISAVKELSQEYQVFMELGGKKHCPARYCDAWSREAEYVIFAVFDPVAEKFLFPEDAKKIVESYGLRYVEFEPISDLIPITRDWIKTLGRFVGYEGYVAKLYLNDELKEMLFRKHHTRQFNVLMAKFKHEYLNIPEDKQPWLEPSEVFAVLDRARLEMPEIFYDWKKLYKPLAKLIEEEAKKHGRAVPNLKYVRRLWMEYIQNVDRKA